jgi:enamine deaminase RidA (YjgF/YER057c/UK114 family)
MTSTTARTPAFALRNPPGLYNPAPNGYSHLGVVEPGARLIFVAGQGGETQDGALAADFAAQVEQALANLETALADAGATLADVVKLTVLIVDHDHDRLAIFGQRLVRALRGAPAPTCTLIPVPRLALDGMLFEIEATAAVTATG